MSDSFQFFSVGPKNNQVVWILTYIFIYQFMTITLKSWNLHVLLVQSRYIKLFSFWYFFICLLSNFCCIW